MGKRGPGLSPVEIFKKWILGPFRASLGAESNENELSATRSIGGWTFRSGGPRLGDFRQPSRTALGRQAYTKKNPAYTNKDGSWLEGVRTGALISVPAFLLVVVTIICISRFFFV